MLILHRIEEVQSDFVVVVVSAVNDLTRVVYVHITHDLHIKDIAVWVSPAAQTRCSRNLFSKFDIKSTTHCKTKS